MMVTCPTVQPSSFRLILASHFVSSTCARPSTTAPVGVYSLQRSKCIAYSPTPNCLALFFFFSSSPSTMLVFFFFLHCHHQTTVSRMRMHDIARPSLLRCAAVVKHKHEIVVRSGLMSGPERTCTVLSAHLSGLPRLHLAANRLRESRVSNMVILPTFSARLGSLGASGSTTCPASLHVLQAPTGEKNLARCLPCLSRPGVPRLQLLPKLHVLIVTWLAWLVGYCAGTAQRLRPPARLRFASLA